MDIEIKNLVKTFGSNKAVDDISFRFSSGNIMGFIGPNGAGKTTTIRMMSTLDLPDSGDILYDGISALEEPALVREIIGYMPDALPEHDDITVNEYLDFFARAYGLKGAKKSQTLANLEEFTGLGNMRDKYLKSLSKGMKQRVSLARALVHDPKVLIMDEPAAGLDPRARIELRELMSILTEQGKAILISSHILSELEGICHSTVIIEKGKIVHTGTTNDFNNSKENINTNVFVRALVGADKLLKHIVQLPFVVEGKISTNNEVLLKLEGGEDEVAQLLKQLVAEDLGVVEFRQQGMGLEELFMNVTKGEVK